MEYFARSHVKQIDPGLLPLLVKVRRVEVYLQSIAAVALVYDALITMDREIKYFWKVPKKPVDFAYFVNRYIGIIGAVSVFFALTFSADLKKCNFALWTQVIASWLTMVLTDYVLTIRVLALYSRDRTLTLYLCSFLAIETAATLGTSLYMLVFGIIAVGRVEGVSTCVIERNPPWQSGIVSWSVQLAYGVILMVLALYKASEYWRLSNGFKGFRLVRVLIEDQIIYFVAFILVSACTISIFRLKLERLNIVILGILWTLSNPTFLCILGSRMFLSLKEAGERGQNEGTSFVSPLRTISEIEFGRLPASVKASQKEEIISE